MLTNSFSSSLSFFNHAIHVYLPSGPKCKQIYGRQEIQGEKRQSKGGVGEEEQKTKNR